MSSTCTAGCAGDASQICGNRMINTVVFTGLGKYEYTMQTRITNDSADYLDSFGLSFLARKLAIEKILSFTFMELF
jgi:hypothetical protein